MSDTLGPIGERGVQANRKRYAPDPDYPPCTDPHHDDRYCSHCEGLRDGVDWERDRTASAIAAARLDAARAAIAHCIDTIKNAGPHSVQWMANDWLNLDDAGLARIVAPMEGE